MEPEPSCPQNATRLKSSRGDQLIFQTAGGGGWGDPLERDIEKVRVDVVRELVSVEKAAADYGVVYDPATSEVDGTATQALRQSMKKSRDEPHTFDFGPPLQELLARCKEETGLEPPIAPALPPGWETNGVKKVAA